MGAVYQSPAVFHVEFHNYCYPTVGVEMNLGALPVTECNRWDPDVDGTTTAVRRKTWQGTREGRTFEIRVAEWEAARRAEAHEASEAERLVAGALEAANALACQFCGKRFPATEIGALGECSSCGPRALTEERNRRAMRQANNPDKDSTP